MAASSFLSRLQRGAQAVLVAMLAVMFVTFIAQVVFRYALNLPLAWTEELSTLLWMWGIFWGASFVMRNSDDIRFDMLYNLLPHGARRWMTVVASGAIVLVLLASLPAAWGYVSFMKVEKSAAMGLPMNWVFSIYIVFVLAMCVRHAYVAWQALHGRLVQDAVAVALHDAEGRP
ncbi:MAG: TRAP transporter small permease [Rubrivivax sp.]|nr:TRAP transporter small permease [Rubrivivax sp.]